jgi:ribosomal protein S27AE
VNEANAYLARKPCPKCGYVRTAADANPAWQCPKCQIAYLKYHLAAPMLGARLAAGGRQLAGKAVSDHSVYVLIAANLVASAIAIAFHMTLRDLMLVYWAQSVIIGISFFIRILSLQNFSTEGMKINHQPVAEEPASKWKVALFFLFHYGFFHFVYFMFIVVDPASAGSAPMFSSTAGLWLCAGVFALNHAFSLRHNIEEDRLGKPNLGTLMMLPYARIIPMHLTILLGGTFFGGTRPLLAMFIVLKTIADVIMHTVEHHVLSPKPAPS